MQDVPNFLERKGLTFECYMNPEQSALVAPSHAVRLNYETYLFGDSAARETFRGDPVRYCGMLTDPVGKIRFRPHEDSPRLEHEKVLYFFASDENFDLFASDPENYRLPGFTMASSRPAPERTESE